MKVTGLPTNVNDEEVELYFETQKFGGRKGSIKKCVIEQNGVAFIEFDDPEGTAVKHAMQTRHYACTHKHTELTHTHTELTHTHTSRLFTTSMSSHTAASHTFPSAPFLASLSLADISVSPL